MAYSGLFYVLGRGKEPWTLHHGKPDNEKLLKKEDCKVSELLFFESTSVPFESAIF